MENAVLLNGAKWVGAVVLVIAAAIFIYLGAVLQVYLIAWVVELIGIIFN